MSTNTTLIENVYVFFFGECGNRSVNNVHGQFSLNDIPACVCLPLADTKWHGYYK